MQAVFFDVKLAQHIGGTRIVRCAGGGVRDVVQLRKVGKLFALGILGNALNHDERIGR